MTFGLHAFGEQPFGYAELAGPNIVTLYASTDGYTSKAGDTPERTHFPARVMQAFQYRRSLLGGPELGGLVTQGYGDLIFDNADGFWDAIVRDYTVDGREIRTRLGDMDLAYGSFAGVWNGTARGWSATDMEMRIGMRDFGFLLDRVLQRAFYGGTGGLDGGDDLAGRPRPVALGFCENVTPAYLGVLDLGDGPLHTYQVNWRSVQGVTEVREGGLAYDEVTEGAPSGGEWKQDASLGIFQIGSTPIEAITADVEGDDEGGYVETLPDVVGRLLTDFSAAFGESRIEAATFAELASDVPGPVNHYIGTEPANLGATIGALLAGAAAWGGFNRPGRFEVRALKAPGTPRITLTEAQIKGAPERLGPGELPESVQLPTKRRRIGYRRNWTVQRGGVLAGATEAVRSFVTDEYRVAESFDNATETRNSLAGDPEMIPSPFNLKADAEAVCQRLMDLFGGLFEFYRVRARCNYFAIELGTTVRLRYPRLNIQTGGDFIVVDYEIDSAANAVTLTLFRPGD